MRGAVQFLSLALCLWACRGCAPQRPPPGPPRPAGERAKALRDAPAAALPFTVLDPGEGPERAVTGMMVEVRFTVTAPDGGLVNSSGSQDAPFRFILERPGPPPVVDELAHGMSPGSRRRAMTVEGLTFLGRPPGDTLELEVYSLDYVIAR